jgi:hypothetical protein
MPGGVLLAVANLGTHTALLATHFPTAIPSPITHALLLIRFD